nr:MarR family transcriptional regulator [Acidimicrobiia bacterium]
MLHQLRVKGLASAEALAEATGIGADVVAAALPTLEADGLVQQRGGRMPGWTLTASGRDEAARLLAEEQATPGLRPQIDTCYRRFLDLNEPFKGVCTAWQVRDLEAMILNNHTDPAYDAGVVDRLGSLHDQAVAITADLTACAGRFGGYGPRLSAAYRRVRDGDHRWFTTPLIGSYHDIWM